MNIGNFTISHRLVLMSLRMWKVGLLALEGI